MTQVRMKQWIQVSGTLLLLAAVAGCSSSSPQEASNEVEYNVASGKVAAPPPVPVTPVENAAENVAAVDPLPPEKPVPVDQQTLDDASATDMTSHVARDQEPAPAQ